jgi:hypothetical protein
MYLGCDEKIFPLGKSSFKCLGKCITNFSLVLVVSCKTRKPGQLENHRHNTLQIHHCQLRAITIERKQDILYSLILANLLLIAKFKPHKLDMRNTVFFRIRLKFHSRAHTKHILG